MALDFATREKFDELDAKLIKLQATLDAITSQLASVKASLANLRRPRA